MTRRELRICSMLLLYRQFFFSEEEMKEQKELFFNWVEERLEKKQRKNEAKDALKNFVKKAEEEVAENAEEKVSENAEEEVAEKVEEEVAENAEEELLTEKDKEFILKRYDDVNAHVREIDKKIEEVSKGWKVSRINYVDLSLIRLAYYEMKYDEDVPVAVAINEAVDIAKIYGEDDSYSFVNGILAKLI